LSVPTPPTSSGAAPGRTATSSLNARLRDELLNGEIFYTHASIGYKPPAPEVFVPAFAAWPATSSAGHAGATALTFHLDHSAGADHYRLAIRLPDDHDHLLFCEPRFAHCSLRIGSQSLT
jgi:hypothetical protein